VKTLAVIPARWGSTRFPGKALAELCGKPVIQHVWEKACEAEGIHEVVVATDDDRIATAVAAFGGRAEMTRSDHRSGSDRVAEVAARSDAEVVINLQGDEPLVRPSDLARLAELMRLEPDVEVASLCHAISAEEASNPHRVKAVRGADGNALYFSRARIPYPRDVEPERYLQHVGVYACRRGALLAFPGLPVSPEERAEALEQLRYLAAGIAIRLIEVEPTGPGIDTPEDLERVEALLSA
jgi:3-deoxy-manno-octulosonate cytidylyltransferase (CMP-KDO synthetase)